MNVLCISLRNISSACLIKYPWHTQQIIAWKRNLSHEGQMILIRSHSKSSLALMAQLSTKHWVTLRCRAGLPSFPFHTGCCSCVPVSPSAWRADCPQSSGWDSSLLHWFLTPCAPQSRSAHLNMCTECPHQTCGGAGTAFIYLFIHSRGELEPLHPPRASSRSAVSPASRGWAQMSLPSSVLSRAQGHSQRDGWTEILTNSGCCLHKPPSSSLLHPGRDLVSCDSAQAREAGASQSLSYSSDI